MVIAFSVAVAIVCIYTTICLIIYRRKISTWTMSSAILLLIGGTILMVDKNLITMGYYGDIENIAFTLSLVTVIPALCSLFIEAYIKAVRYNPTLKKFVLVLLGIMVVCILLFILFSILEKVTNS